MDSKATNKIGNVSESGKKPRREKGSGTIFKMDDNTFRGQLTVHTSDNGKRRKSFSGKSEADVKRQMKAYQAEINKYAPGAAENLTLKTYMNHWLTLYKEPALKQSSYNRIKLTVDKHVSPIIGHIQLQALTTAHIQGLITEKSKDVSINSHSSIKKIFDAINECLQFAVTNGDLARNPCALVSLPARSNLKPTKEIRFFNDEEKDKILNEVNRKYKNGAPVYPYGNAIVVILNTGLRLGEILALKREDIDLETKALYVKSTLIRAKKTGDTKSKLIIQNEPKTSAGVRTIPLNIKALGAIKALLSANPQSEYLICTKNGGVVSPNNLDRTFERMLENIGMQKCGVHTLRHTFATDLFHKGADVKTVSGLLGHATATITMNIYIHAIEDKKIDVVSLLDDIAKDENAADSQSDNS